MRLIAVALLAFCCQLSGAYFTSMAGGKLSVALEFSPSVSLYDDGVLHQSQTFYLEIPVRKGMAEAQWDETTETFTIMGLDLELASQTIEWTVRQKIDVWGGSEIVEHLFSFSFAEQHLLWDFEVPFPLQQRWNEEGYYVWEWDSQNTGGEFGYPLTALPETWLDGLITIEVSGSTHETVTHLNLPAAEEFEIRKLGLGQNVFGRVHTEFHPWERGDGWITRSLSQPYTSPGSQVSVPEIIQTFEISFFDTNGSLQAPWIYLTDPTLRLKFRWMHLRLPEDLFWAVPYGTAFPSQENIINIPQLGEVSLDHAPWVKSSKFDPWIYCPPQDFDRPFWMYISRQE